MKQIFVHITAILLAGFCVSCSSSGKFTRTYYQQHEQAFVSIKSRFKDLYNDKPFSLALRNKAFSEIELEIITDSMKYIYRFDIDEPRLTDTLLQYRFNAPAMLQLARDMQAVHCTWITNLDYYENREEKYLVFLSVRHRQLKAFLRPEKYFTLAFFDRPQRFDQQDRLLDAQDQKNLRRINGVLFRKINSRVCYSLSPYFR